MSSQSRPSRDPYPSRSNEQYRGRSPDYARGAPRDQRSSSQHRGEARSPLEDADEPYSRGQGERTARVRPAHEVRFGSIRAAIWENQTDHGIRYNVTVSRIYKLDDKWRGSNSFNRDDLLIVAKAMDLCHTWIFEQTQASD